VKAAIAVTVPQLIGLGAITIRSRATEDS